MVAACSPRSSARQADGRTIDLRLSVLTARRWVIRLGCCRHRRCDWSRLLSLFAARTPHERECGQRTRCRAHTRLEQCCLWLTFVIFRHGLRRQRLLFNDVSFASSDASDHTMSESLQAHRSASFLLCDVAPAPSATAFARRADSSSALVVRGPVLWQRDVNSSPIKGGGPARRARRWCRRWARRGVTVGAIWHSTALNELTQDLLSRDGVHNSACARNNSTL